MDGGSVHRSEKTDTSPTEQMDQEEQPISEESPVNSNWEGQRPNDESARQADNQTETSSTTTSSSTTTLSTTPETRKTNKREHDDREPNTRKSNEIQRLPKTSTPYEKNDKTGGPVNSFRRGRGVHGKHADGVNNDDSMTVFTTDDPGTQLTEGTPKESTEQVTSPFSEDTTAQRRRLSQRTVKFRSKSLRDRSSMNVSPTTERLPPEERLEGGVKPSTIEGRVSYEQLLERRLDDGLREFLTGEETIVGVYRRSIPSLRQCAPPYFRFI
jgi:hypothetical protein